MRFARRAVFVSGAAPATTTASDPPRARSRPRWDAHISGYGVALVGVLVLALAFYMWTAASSIPFTFSSVGSGHLQRSHDLVPARSYVPTVRSAPGTAASRRPLQPGAERALQRRLPRPGSVPRALLLPVGADAGPDAVRPLPDHRAADVGELCRGAVRVGRPGLLGSAPACSPQAPRAERSTVGAAGVHRGSGAEPTRCRFSFAGRSSTRWRSPPGTASRWPVCG